MKLDPKIGRSLKKASPTILTCIGAAGVVATAALAVKATPKADSLIKADSRRNHDGDPYAATKLEAVKSCWKCYIPAAATGVATIICIFGANTLNKKQQASLASAYALVNRSYSDYKHMLGFKRTKAGAVVGWIYDDKKPYGDNFVDFGMTEIRRHDADSDEYKRAFILDFNVVGDITSKIVDHQNDYLA